MSELLWKTNMTVLKKLYPKMARFLENNSNEELPVTAGAQDVSGKAVLYAVKEEKVFQLDSLYDSNEFLELWFSGLKKEWELNSKMLMFGLGNGMYVRKLLEKTSDDHKIIIYEPSDSILRTVLQEYDLTDIIENPRVYLLFKSVLTKSIESYYYDYMNFLDINSFQYQNYLNYNQLFQTEYNDYMTALQNACNAINSSQSVMDRFGKQYNENTFANLNAFIKSYSLESLFRNMPKNIPAIVVAAGPSLDKNIKYLHEAKGKALIIAVDSAIRPLLREGITPDLCITVDGKKNIRHFSDEASKKIPMVCMLLSQRAVLKNHTAEKFFINDMNMHIQKFMEKNGLTLPVTSTGGSVANDAFSLAKILGAKTIILVGQDLAYTDNKTHASKTVRGEKNQDASQLANTLWVDGIDGNPVLSSGEFQIYRVWFEEQIVDYPELKVIDATEGGALIKGSIVETLQEAIETECVNKFDFKSVLAKTRYFFNEDIRNIFLDYLNQLPENIKECINLTKEGCRIYERILKLIYEDKYRTGEVKKLSSHNAVITEKLEEMPAMEYVKNEIQEQTTKMIQNIYQTEKNEREELLSVCGSGKDYLELIQKTLTELQPKIDVMLEKINSEKYEKHQGDRILVLKGKSTGNVLRLAADQLTAGFEKLGLSVKLIDVCKYSSYDKGIKELLTEIVDSKNKLIVSIQAILFDEIYQGKSILEYADCPVYGWIFDHPVCHESRLKAVKSPIMHVACIDQNHVDLVREYYPDVKNVHFLPHRGFLQSNPIKKWSERSIEILFAGRYFDYKETLKQLDGLERIDPEIARLRDSLLGKMMTGVKLPYEENLKKCLQEMKIPYNRELFLELMNAFYPIYHAAYEKNRQEIIELLLKSGLRITVCGAGWEKFNNAYTDNLTILNEKEYLISDVAELMGDSKIVLNIVPVFRAGAHERIFTAMLANAVCATDENAYLHRILSEEELLFYSFENQQELPIKIKTLLSNPHKAENMIRKAYEKAEKYYTWGSAAKDFLEF